MSKLTKEDKERIIKEAIYAVCARQIGIVEPMPESVIKDFYLDTEKGQIVHRTWRDRPPLL